MSTPAMNCGVALARAVPRKWRDNWIARRICRPQQHAVHNQLQSGREVQGTSKKMLASREQYGEPSIRVRFARRSDAVLQRRSVVGAAVADRVARRLRGVTRRGRRLLWRWRQKIWVPVPTNEKLNQRSQPGLITCQWSRGIMSSSEQVLATQQPNGQIARAGDHGSGATESRHRNWQKQRGHTIGPARLPPALLPCNHY